MKSLYILALLSFATLMSCDTKSPEVNNPKTGKETPANASSLNAESKVPAPRQPTSSPMVESEVKIEEKPVNDQNVDYTAFAKAVCACAAKSNELNNKMQAYSDSGNSQAFTKMVPQVSEAYDRSVECSKGQAEALGSEYSLQKLVKNLKANCGDYHDKLIFQIFLALKKG